MRILVCGGREWVDKNFIRQVLFACREKYGDFSLINGYCRGADLIAHTIVMDMELISVCVPARWVEYGKKRAGPLRNRYMLEKCKPHLVLAFHENLGLSKGTVDMMTIAEIAGVPTVHLEGREEQPYPLPDLQVD